MLKINYEVNKIKLNKITVQQNNCRSDFVYNFMTRCLMYPRLVEHHLR